MISEIINYAIQDSDRYLLLIKQHVVLDLLAFTICVFIAVPLGYLCAKKEKIAGPVVAITTVFMMIPSLAIFAILQPILGLGMLPALVALVLGGTPLIILNTRTGYLNVDKAVCESAYAMGMEPWRVCLQVETPLALPAILNGMRITGVAIVAGTAIATYIGAGGLGFYIDMGLGTRNFAVTYLGAITVAVIAIIVDSVLAFFQKRQLKKVA